MRLVIHDQHARGRQDLNSPAVEGDNGKPVVLEQFEFFLARREKIGLKSVIAADRVQIEVLDVVMKLARIAAGKDHQVVPAFFQIAERYPVVNGIGVYFQRLSPFDF